MLDLTAAKRSQVLKLEFTYQDFELLAACARTILSRGKLPAPQQERLEAVLSDTEILLQTLREEGDV